MPIHLKHILTAAALALLMCGHVTAQSFANNLAASSVDPEADSLAISVMRARLDSIRNTQHRPTVAVVLSGGGAKGAAYIGILRYIEEAGIPVDVICGTSMGGMVGGLYSLGYSSQELEEIFTSVDWGEMMSDDIDMKFVPFDQKMYKSQYGLSIPFYYDDATHIKRNEILEEPFVDGGIESSANRRKLLSTLPMGYINGFNIEAMLSHLSVGYHDDITFDQLPIPFYCVSSDLVSAKANYHSQGSLPKALRSTISIPGVFSPVRLQSKILVDGGTRNNFPVDIARAMGADIIIGAEAAKRGTTYSDVNSALDILACMITMLGDDARSNKDAQPDMVIKPETGNMKVLSFNAAAISELIKYGYESAQNHADDFVKIKERLGDYQKPDANERPKAINLFNDSVRVGGIMINGIDRDEQKMFRKILDLKGYRYVSHQEIKDAMCRVMASGSFEDVTYSMKYNAQAEDYTLVFDCVPGQIHNFGVSLRMDTEETAELMLNLRLNAHKLRGWWFDATGKVSSQQSISLKASYIPDEFAQVNFLATASHVRADIMTRLKDVGYSLAMFNTTQEFFLSTIHGKALDVRAGLRHEYVSVPKGWPQFSATDDYGGMVLMDFVDKGRYLTMFFRTDINTMNDRQFPTNGFFGGFGVDFDMANFADPNFKRTAMFDFNTKFAVPVTEWLTIIPDLYYRGYYGDSAVEGEDYAFFHSNYVGGAIKGRYVRQQIPFVGFNDITHVDNNIGVLNLDIRFKLADKLFLSGQFGMAHEADTFERFLSDLAPDFKGYALELGYKAAFGPVKFNLHWSDSAYSDKLQAYFSMGFDF